MTADEIAAAMQRGKDEANVIMRIHREWLERYEKEQARRRMPKKKAFKGIATPR